MRRWWKDFRQFLGRSVLTGAMLISPLYLFAQVGTTASLVSGMEVLSDDGGTRIGVDQTLQGCTFTPEYDLTIQPCSFSGPE